MYLRLQWPGGRVELLAPVPAARLSEVLHLIEELHAEFLASDQVGEVLGGLLDRPWASTIIERLLAMIPLCGTADRLTLADFHEAPYLLQDLLVGDALGQSALLAEFLEQESNQHARAIKAQVEEPGWLPTDPEAALLAGLALALPDGLGGALQLLQTRSSGFVAAFLIERRCLLDPKFREQRIFDRAEQLAEATIAEHRAELDRAYAAFLRGEDPWNG